MCDVTESLCRCGPPSKLYHLSAVARVACALCVNYYYYYTTHTGPSVGVSYNTHSANIPNIPNVD